MLCVAIYLAKINHNKVRLNTAFTTKTTKTINYVVKYK